MHHPVLYQEIIHALQPRDDGKYVDGTVGAGGHAWGILETSSPGGKLLGLDVDPQALQLARKKLALFGNRAVLERASYTSIAQQVHKLGWEGVDGILLDLGVSSMQLDTSQRGFSFRDDAPLDMRFDPSYPRTAADLVNTLSETELADLLYEFGEERRSRQVARAIVRARPIRTTRQLADLVAKVTKGGRIHPATRTFQALRIAVNRELKVLESALPQIVETLAPSGRFAVIAFHSLEDRIVKAYFKHESKDCVCPPRQPICTCDHKASVRMINPKPIRPSADEIEQNPRARSARLRVVEKIS